MNSFIANEQIIRPTIFIVLLVMLAIAEYCYPLAKRKSSHIRQWSTNITLVIISSLLLKISLPMLAVGAAQWSQSNGVGLINYFEFLSSDYIALFILLLSIVLMDFIIYWQHVLMHKIPLLWSMHQVHHSEAALDVSSAVRFHPFEMLFSMLVKIASIVLLGIPVIAVILFEIILNAMALFNHSNIKLPKQAERQLRKLIVTPEVHWIHHSQIVRETNSNYGFNLIIWDKLFGTYINKPKQDYQDLQQGLSQYNNQQPLNIISLLMLPFRRK
ncbi:sterol desaturase family protein [Psychromonas hadalis]|uniref:sterol desaturase family protein n=1 Tax=Psychromonas hadalis TaxID=211669 RepID=UPI0003B584FB|nr:sterol desaturase family protein [Psychromonas hadalis]